MAQFLQWSFLIVCITVTFNFESVSCRPHNVQYEESSPSCTEWIDPFWNIMTLNEPRQAVIEDLRRLFIIMDYDANTLVSEQEFHPTWETSTMMTEVDTTAIFMWWVTLGDQNDPQFINDNNIDAVWKTIDLDKDGFSTESEFTKSWEKVLPMLPNKGCP